MRTSYAHPAERQRGCCLDLRFNSSETIQSQGGTITGAVQYDREKGIALDGVNDWITYGAGYTGQLFDSGFFSVVCEFTPNFEANDAGGSKAFFDAPGSGGNRALFYFYSVGGVTGLLGYAGATSQIINVAYAAFSPYWRTNRRNVLAFACRSGANYIWLNGVLVGSSVTPWVAAPLTSFTVGRSMEGRLFPGFLHSIKFFRHNAAAELLTAQEALDYFNKSSFQYRARATCILNMGLDQHDVETNPTGVQLLTDGDMEAVGTAAWPVGGGATAAKVAGTRTGGTGTQVLRITKDAAATDWVSQDIWLPVVKYRVSGWARGDGIASYPTMGDNALTYWAGTTSTTWQSFSLDVTSTTGIGPYLNAIGGGAGGWVEFDDIVVERYHCRTLDTSGRGNHFTLGDGSTASMMPTKLATRGYRGTSVQTHMVNNGALITAGGARSMFLLCRSLDTSLCAIAKMYGPNPFPGAAIEQNIVAGKWHAYESARKNSVGSMGSGLVGLCYTASVSGGYVMYKNAVIDSSGAIAAMSANTGPNYLFGVPGAGYVGEIFYFALYPFALTPLQIANEYSVALRGLNRAG